MALLVTLLTTLIFIIIISNNTVNAESPVCQRSSEDKALCSKVTKDAPTWSAAMTNALNYELDYVKAGKSIIDAGGSKLPSSTDPKVKQDIIQSCNRRYQDVVRSLNLCFQYVARDPGYSLPSAVGSQDLDCTLLIRVSNIPVPSDLADFTKNFKKIKELLYGIALARRFLPPSGPLGK